MLKVVIPWCNLLPSGVQASLANKKKNYFFTTVGKAFVNSRAHLLLQKYNLICVLALCMLTSPTTLFLPHFAHLSVKIITIYITQSAFLYPHYWPLMQNNESPMPEFSKNRSKQLFFYPDVRLNSSPVHIHVLPKLPSCGIIDKIVF